MDRRRFLVLAGTVAAASKLQGVASAESSAELAARLAQDVNRPQFHFLPAANWMNDPNGPLYFKGKYHMFYQYSDDRGADSGTKLWGHAMGEDMVHWRHLPVALTPTAGSADADGCWTGTAIVQDGVPTFLYTGVKRAPVSEQTTGGLREQVCLATSDDPMLRVWKKLPQAVIDAPPAGMKVNGFRDPSPWKQGDRYLMVMGSGTAELGGAILLYESKDLLVWKFVHVLCQRKGNSLLAQPKPETRESWECPEFFPLGEKWVLMTSFDGKGQWFSGEFNTTTLEFRPEKTGTLDYGAYYAPKTQLDAKGNRIIWGWVTERRSAEACRAAGWNGVMSLPRVLTLDADGNLKTAFAKETAMLRGPGKTFHPGKDAVGKNAAAEMDRLRAMQIDGYAGEIAVRVVAPQRVSLILRETKKTEDAREWLSIGFDPKKPNAVMIDGEPFPMHGAVGEEISVHLFVDGSVVEVIINNEVCYTKRVYSSSGSAEPLWLWCNNADWIEQLDWVHEAKVWPVRAITKDRLTT